MQAFLSEFLQLGRGRFQSSFGVLFLNNQLEISILNGTVWVGKTLISLSWIKFLPWSGYTEVQQKVSCPTCIFLGVVSRLYLTHMTTVAKALGNQLIQCSGKLKYQPPFHSLIFNSYFFVCFLKISLLFCKVSVYMYK